MKKPLPISSFFFHFVLYNLCFFGLQLILIYSHADNLISSVKLPLEVYFEFAGTLVVQVALYLIIAVFQTGLLIGILKRQWDLFSTEQWQVIIWSIFACTILSANAYYFPLSIFSKLFAPPISEFFISIILCLSLFLLSLLVINALLYRKSLAVSGAAIIVFLGVGLIYYLLQSNSQLKPQTQPNIIILGIDSLSPESVTPNSMPNLYNLLQKSTQFTKTISPLARTYPAWSSILTGLYPEHNHAEENLVARSNVDSKTSIVWTLNQMGYNTIYATDDRRFNSIDTDFGFNKIIGPKTGVNDVILGSYNDFPLGNLLINFRISAWLFPYNYSSRASYFSYYPETFSNKLQRELSHQPDKPVFLAVHFALPHWPYAWASSLPDKVNNEFSLNKRDGLYKRAIKRVDDQFQTFYIYLQEHGYLTNSLVILLSDHGEVLYYPNTRLTNYHNYQSVLTSKLAEYFKNKTATDLDKSAGHGSDILSPKQYHCVLAFSVYNKGQLVTGTKKIDTRVALIDLAPTILAFLNEKLPHSMDGISLLQSILNPDKTLPERTFFIESGMFPNQDFSKEKAIELGHRIYTVNPKTGELELKPDELIKINNEKLYGVISGDWILALYPDDTSYIPVIQNLSNGKWTDDLNSSFAKTTPAATLKRQIKNFYGKKLTLPIP